jgi:DNA processing protein
MRVSITGVEPTHLDADVDGRLLCLASIDIKPDRLGRLLTTFGLDRTWCALTKAQDPGHRSTDEGGIPPNRLSSWARELRAVRPDRLARSHEAAGLHVLGLGLPGYPERLALRPHPSGVLVVQGDPSCLHAERAVAIVGTRKASDYGRQVAKRLGRDLADAGVTVVSGLARGIDGAAHEGALGRWSTPASGCGVGGGASGASGASGQLGRPVGVIAHGHDHVYPSAHKSLFSQVRQTGALVSERPLGVGPQPHFFPQRNGVIAGLASLLVVVESASGGGSMITVDLANRAGIDIMAVPGSVFSEVSDGCNKLLNDGLAPCRSVTDVLDALNGIPRAQRGTRQPMLDFRREPGPDGARVLQALGWIVQSVETLLSRCPGMTPGQLLLVLHELEFDQWVSRGSDGWFQRATP